jgi:hypothetical protein
VHEDCSSQFDYDSLQKVSGKIVSQLERWGDRLLDARTLEDLFG